jgi:phosphoglycolate phosphatase-like HAD superfamily hydrolase
VIDELENEFSALASAGIPRPFEGMPELIERLARRNAVVVITSSRSDDVNRVVAEHHLRGIAEVLGADTATSKLVKIRMARERHGNQLKPWYVGDTVGDIVEAKAAGVGSIGVGWGWQGAQKLQAAEPDLMAYSPDDLLVLE